MKRDIAIEIIAPTLGIEKRLGDSMIDKRNTPNAKNCDAYYGVVQKDYGTSLYATGTSSGTAIAVIGAPINLIYPAIFGGNTTLQVFSQTKMYQYQACGTATGTRDNFILDCSGSYTGTYTDFWKACMHNNAMIYTNGVDLVQAKTSYNGTGAVMAGVATGSYKAWVVQSFKEHLNLYHTYESGNECNKRVRWTKVGLLGYTSTDWTSGVAGFQDIQDVDGQILTAEKLGNGAVAIYGDGSIHLQQWVGGSSVFQFTKMLNGVTIPSRRAVVSNDNIHYVVTRDNIYSYAGGNNLTPIGDAVKADYITNLNQPAADKIFTQFIREENELRVYVPTGTSTDVDTCYICKVNDNNAWFKAQRPYTACGQFTRQASLRIGDLPFPIGTQNWRIGDASGKEGANTHVLGDVSGRVVKMDKTVYTISNSGASTPQEFIFDTKDITSINDVDPMVRDRYNLTEYMDNQTRWLGTRFEAMGYGTMSVLYSTDNGSTWTEFDESPVTLDSQWKMYVCDLDRAKERLRLRFTNSSTNDVAHLRYVKVQFVPGADSQWG